MTYSPKVLEIIGKLKLFLNKESTKLNFRISSNVFIRNSGKLSFYTYVLLGISVIKNSLAIEVHNLLTTNKLNSISKSAYSQGRYKIQSKLYQVLNNLFLSLVYEVSNPLAVESNTELSLRKWRGYFLEAIDGTCLVLPQTKELGDSFGLHKNGAGKTKIVETCMAKCLVRADLLNKYVIQNEVFKTTESELSICKTWLW